MADSIIDFITIALPTQPKNFMDETDPLGDTPTSLFLNGKAVISHTLSQKINITLHQYLFLNIPQRRNTRIIFLLILKELCKNKTILAQIGGSDFFRGLLKNRSPDIA
jgi:hypothetical protein